jgi:hypothetical protein
MISRHPEQLMLTFKEFLDSPEYVIVKVPVNLIDPRELLNEGKWRPSGKPGWMQRIDAENPSIPLQRHVHVAKSNHVSSKTQQAAWNEDGTRHDKKTFNDKVGSLDAARSIARAALKLGDDVILEQIGEAQRLLLLEEVRFTSKLQSTPWSCGRQRQVMGSNAAEDFSLNIPNPGRYPCRYNSRTRPHQRA